MSITESDAQARTLALAVDLRALISGLQRKMREQAHFGDLTLSQASVLSHLDRYGPSTVTALARVDGVRPQSMGATVAALEAMDSVAGAPDPADGRQTIYSLTAKARDRLKANRATREDWLFKVLQTKFTRREQETLAASIDLLKRIVDS